MHDPPGRDAMIVRQALRKDLLNLETATEVICSRTSSQIQVFKQHYYAKYGVHLEHDIELRASGDHKKLLLAYVSTPRYEGREVDRAMAEKDAKALYKAGEKRWGTDEKTFIRVFCERSAAHLTAVDSPLSRHAIKNETSGQFEHALKTILQCSENPAKHFAKLWGHNDSALIRVIVTRTEIDMQYIKAEYRKEYKKTLNDAVN
uniref:Annexin n=1 Tax=Salix viminalis TaxID=40686 RepID=A0A6N2KJL8_SALVM